MAVYVVGDFLRETRLRKGYTQEEVSYGICTPASLSRIENGAQKPGRLILEKLFERLGTENNLFNSFVSREEMELYSAIQELVRNITDDDVAKIEKQIEVVEKLAVNTTELEHQCLYFAKGELARQKEKDDKKAMEMYMKAIHITLPDFDGKNPLRNNLLTFDEIMIINSIAILYANRENDIMNKLAEKAKIEQLREEILEMLKTQNFISKINENRESEKLNIRYEELSKKINSNIKLIEELENYIKPDLEIFIDTIKANNHHVKIEIYTRRASI